MSNPQKLPKYVTDLIKVYSDAQLRLINIIANKEAKGNITTYQKSLLRQVDYEIEMLNKFVIDWVNDNIPASYELGVSQVISQFENMGIQIAEYAAFSQLHNRAVSVLVQNTTDDLITANNYVGRVIRDNVRTAGIDVISQKVATGATVKDAKKILVNRLIDEGMTGILTKSGRIINLNSYAQLVARSTTREATNRATMNHIQAVGHDLVKMSNHRSPCPVCAPLEGRVYSISGKDPDFPPLTIAYRGIYANVHPNCRHVLTPYIKEFNDVDKDKQFSNRTFDTDPRSQAEIDAYNAEQEYNRKLNTDRRQFEKYRLSLPDDAPKTLSGFRRMKEANSERYQELVSNYRSLRQSN